MNKKYFANIEYESYGYTDITNERYKVINRACTINTDIKDAKKILDMFIHENGDFDYISVLILNASGKRVLDGCYRMDGITHDIKR